MSRYENECVRHKEGRSVKLASSSKKLILIVDLKRATGLSRRRL